MMSASVRTVLNPDDFLNSTAMSATILSDDCVISVVIIDCGWSNVKNWRTLAEKLIYTVLLLFFWRSEQFMIRIQQENTYIYRTQRSSSAMDTGIYWKRRWKNESILVILFALSQAVQGFKNCAWLVVEHFFTIIVLRELRRVLHTTTVGLCREHKAVGWLCWPAQWKCTCRVRDLIKPAMAIFKYHSYHF